MAIHSNGWLHTHATTADSSNKTKHRVYHEDQGWTASAGYRVCSSIMSSPHPWTRWVSACWMAVFGGAARGPEPRGGVRVRGIFGLVRA